MTLTDKDIKSAFNIAYRSAFCRCDRLNRDDCFQLCASQVDNIVKLHDPSQSKIFTYLVKSFKNRLFTYIHKNRFQLFCTVEYNDTYDSPQNVPNEGEISIDNQHILRIIKDVLTEREQIVIKMRYYEDCSYEEIARVLKCSFQNVRNIHEKILKQLKTHV